MGKHGFERDDLLWLAGFMERYTAESIKSPPAMRVAMYDQGLAQRMSVRFGGFSEERIDARDGRTYWRWRIAGTAAAKVFAAVRPHLDSESHRAAIDAALSHQPKKAGRKASLSQEDQALARKMHAEGVSAKDLTGFFDVSVSTIYRALTPDD